MARHDRFGRGGDHTAFNQQGFPGVRFTESNENYARQHAVADTFEGVSPAYLARNARVNVSIDDFIFGVAAHDASGHQSLVSAHVNPPRPMIDVKTR